MGEVSIAREGNVNPLNAIKFSPFGESFDSGDAYRARVTAREALSKASTPPLYGTTNIDLGVQGSVNVRHTGGLTSGSMDVTLNGRNITKVDYSRYNPIRKTPDDAFKEVKRRLGSYVSV